MRSEDGRSEDGCTEGDRKRVACVEARERLGWVCSGCNAVSERRAAKAGCTGVHRACTPGIQILDDV